MDYKFEKGNSEITLVLLHGTGGTKEDLIPLARNIDPEANILALEGDVNEQGMKRFFKRIRPGVFDEEDLIKRTHALYAYLDEIAKDKALNREKFIGIGYSNGANILASMIYHYSQPLMAAFLHHPMVPLQNTACHDQNNMPIFIGAGNNDPICPSPQTLQLAKVFNQCHALVDIHWHDKGHELTRGELEAAKSYYNDTLKKSQ